nr:hypothetical protein [Pseudobutyrivibrio sp.]
MALLIIGICVGIALMVTLPLYFTRKNEAAAAKEEFEEYIDKLRACDHKYSPLSRQLSNNLNTINFWLKTGRNPADDDEDSKIAENAHRFYSGQMDRVEARRWANAVKEAQNSEAAVKEAKAKRNKEFTLTGLKGMDFGQSEMTFYYDRTYSDQIYYCVSNDAL